MKVGVANLGSGGLGGPEPFAQAVRDVEQFGFESIWTFEHICVPLKHSPYPGTPDGQVPGGDKTAINEPMMQLTYAAALTSKLKLGTGAILLPLHHPLYLAKQLATLDVLSKGRVLFAFANGWCKEEYEALGIDWKKRGKRSDESIQAMRALWRDETSSFAGQQFHFQEVYSFPKPVQKDGLPVIVGGYAPSAARRAGRLGDGFYPLIPDLAELKKSIALMRDEARKHGRNPDEIEITTIAPDPTLDAIKALQDLGVSRVNVRVPTSSPAEMHRGLEKIANSILAKL